MSYELVGKLFLKENENVISEKFKKRDFVVLKEENVGGQIYSEHIKFQLTQDNCSKLDSVNVNDEITVKFNIKGRKWEKDSKVSFFNNLDAWFVSKGDTSSDKPSKPASSSESGGGIKSGMSIGGGSASASTITEESTDKDDLPF